MKIRLTRSIKKHIRREKARIRREFLDEKDQEVQIKKIYTKFIPSTEHRKK